MTNKEQHLSRGYTKEGKKVVGYYFYNELTKKHFITYTAPYKECRQDLIERTEITSPPQKCLGIRDCEGELIFERGILEYLWQGKIETITASLEELGYINDLLFFTEFKIIHPTNKEEQC